MVYFWGYACPTSAGMMVGCTYGRAQGHFVQGVQVMNFQPLDPNQRYQIWYLQFGRKNPKFVEIPGTIRGRSAAWAHVFALSKSRLYKSGEFVCRPVGQAPDDPPSTNCLFHFHFA